MKRRVIIILILIFLLILNGCSSYSTVDNSFSKDQLTEQEKLDDFEYMYKILKENYPFFEVNKRLNGVDWLNNKDKYIEMIKTSKNDKEFYTALNNILSFLNNGHTHMINEQDYKFYQEILKSMKPWANQLNNPKVLERYNVKKESSNNSSGDLDQYKTKNNVTSDFLEKEKIAYIRIKNFLHSNITEDMKIIKPFFNDIRNANALVIDIRGNGGGSDVYWMEYLVPMLINKPLKTTHYYVYRGGDFSEDFIKLKFGRGYEELESIKNISKEGLKNSPPELYDSFKYYFKHSICIEPKKSDGFKGKIYLLVDRFVYSSSEKFALFSKNTGFATLIGEKTGGDGIGTDPLVCALPNSGYVFRFTGEMGLTSDGSCNEEFKTEPNINVHAERTVILKNDRAIKKVIELERNSE